MKLYWIPKSPYARKVMIVALEHDLNERIEYVKTTVSPANPELMRFNPLNKVPTLVLDDGTGLYDSPVICEYLDSLGKAEQSLYPKSSTARVDALRRQALGDGFMDLLIAWRTEVTSPPEQQSADRIQKNALKSRRILEVLNTELTTSRFDIGDVAIGCAVGYLKFRFPQLMTSDHAQLTRWQEDFERRPSAAATRITDE